MNHYPKSGPFPRSTRLVLIAMLTLAAPIFAARQADLGNTLERTIRRAPIGDARVGVSVIDLDSSETLFAYDDGGAFIPASNMKLLTSGAALAVLGPDFAFTTRVMLNEGELVIAGDGDPALGDPEQLELLDPPLGVEDLLDAIAQAVVSQGTTSIDSLVLDPRVFDGELIHPRWPRDQLDRAYCAPVSGVSFHAGTIWFYFSPGSSASAPARIRVSPESPWLGTRLDNRATTSSGSTARIGVLRDPTRDRFRLIGSLGVNAAPVRVSLHRPDDQLALALGTALTKAGVEIRGWPSESAFRTSSADEPRATGRVLAKITTPLQDVLTRCNVDSENLYAEALLKRSAHAVTGRPGSWTDGAGVLRMVIAERVGPESAQEIRVSDGSGLSRGNSVSPRLMTLWLASFFKDEQLRDHFMGSLPRVGEGTLRKRFPGERPDADVLAKSGTINGVRTLSGYMFHEESGRNIAFSVLVNDLPLTPGMGAEARRLHEQIVLDIDNWLDSRVGSTR